MNQDFPLETPKDAQEQPFLPQLLTVMEGISGPIYSLDWSSDGNTLAAAGFCQIKLWDVETFKEITILQGHESFIWGLAWSPDSKYLASASQDGSVKIWDVAAREKVADLQTGTWAFCVAWSPDGKRLAVGSFTSEGQEEHFFVTAQIWDMRTRQQVHALDVTAFINDIAWAPNGRKDVGSLIISTEWSPDSHTIAIGQMDGKILLWDGETDKPHKLLLANTERSDVNGLSWSSDGKLLATAQQDGKVRIWDADAGEIRMILNGLKGWLRGIAWSPDGRLLASAGEDAKIHVWVMNSGQRLADLSFDSLPVCSLRWSPDGKYLAAGSGVFGNETISGKVMIFQTPDIKEG